MWDGCDNSSKVKRRMTESYFCKRVRPDYSLLGEAPGTCLSLVEAVLWCDNYVDTKKTIPPLATRAVNTAAAVVRTCLI